MCLRNFRLDIPRKVLLHVETRHFIVRVAHLDGWDSGICRMRGDVAKNDCACSDFCTIADVDVSEQLGVCAEHDSVSDFRVAVADFVTGSAQGHAV